MTKDKDITFTPYDTAEFLRTPEEIADYLAMAFRQNGTNSRALARALGVAARAYGMQKLSEATGLQRQGLYKSLSGDGNPSFDTIVKVMEVFGVALLPVIVQKSESSAFSEVANDIVGPKKTRRRRAL